MGNDYEAVWPRSRQVVAAKALAPRPDSLDGRTVAFLWDDLFRGDEIWPIITAELSERYEGIAFIDHTEFGSTHGDNEHELIASLGLRLSELEVDAVVSGMGC
jgi:hypothetical protein